MASGADGSIGPHVSASSVVPSWLPKAKVLAPEPPAGYVRRVSLLHHLEGLLERRLTVLRAPAGFGKTTVLADVVRDVKAQELVAGWISLDEDDAPNLFGSCLASAFEHAGLDLARLNAHDAWSSSPGRHEQGEGPVAPLDALARRPLARPPEPRRAPRPGANPRRAPRRRDRGAPLHGGMRVSSARRGNRRRRAPWRSPLVLELPRVVEFRELGVERSRYVAGTHHGSAAALSTSTSKATGSRW
jgi:hypothetical protein